MLYSKLDLKKQTNKKKKQEKVVKILLRLSHQLALTCSFIQFLG